jgi:hypothetical protein
MFQKILTSSFARPSKIYPKFDFWSKNIHTIWQQCSEQRNGVPESIHFFPNLFGQAAAATFYDPLQPNQNLMSINKVSAMARLLAG